MPARICTVSFVDAAGITHAMDVPAETLYEVAVVALAEFRKCGLTGEDAAPGRLSTLKVSVKTPATTHTVPVQKVEQWLAAAARNPKEQLLKLRLREVMSG